jgi:hypothetical protein
VIFRERLSGNREGKRGQTYLFFVFAYIEPCSYTPNRACVSFIFSFIKTSLLKAGRDLAKMRRFLTTASVVIPRRQTPFVPEPPGVVDYHFVLKNEFLIVLGNKEPGTATGGCLMILLVVSV